MHFDKAKAAIIWDSFLTRIYLLLALFCFLLALFLPSLEKLEKTTREQPARSMNYEESTGQSGREEKAKEKKKQKTGIYAKNQTGAV